jgi:hypothetical protein
LIALVALAGLAFASAARADSGSIRFSVYKAGWFIGGSGGDGTLIFHGRRYPISIGGLSAGLVFGASKTTFRGTVSNIRAAEREGRDPAPHRPAGRPAGQRRPLRDGDLGAVSERDPCQTCRRTDWAGKLIPMRGIFRGSERLVRSRIPSATHFHC